jgi:hypothetical protein
MKLILHYFLILLYFDSSGPATILAPTEPPIPDFLITKTEAGLGTEGRSSETVAECCCLELMKAVVGDGDGGDDSLNNRWL